MTAIRLILSILFLILVASFAVKNMHSVGVSYYDYKLDVHTVQLPLMVVVLVPFALGFILAWFFGFLSRIKLKTTMMKQNREIHRLKEELDRAQAGSKVQEPARAATD